MSPEKETLGARLKKAREFNRLTQRQVEEITGIPNTNLSKYEFDILLALANKKRLGYLHRNAHNPFK